MSAGEILLRGFCCAILLAVLVAIGVQDHSNALPLGLFNEGRQVYAVLSWACAAAALIGLIVLLSELWARRAGRVGRTVCALLVSVILLELLLALVDVSLVSRGQARLGGPYRELRGPDGDWVTLKKAHAGSPLGFRSESPHPKRAPGPRVLFIGDSYTEGSGRGPACNYPDVAGATLAEALDISVDVLNAGVAGAGPVGASRVLRLLVAEGYQVDAVVYSLFLENDFTDDLPGTERRVVAGMSYRFPESIFLRLFHPLNGRLFRVSLFVARAGRYVRGGAAAARRESGSCQLVPVRLAEVDPGLRTLVLRRLEANYGTDALLAEGEVARGIGAMRATTRELGVPLVLAVFPDRILADSELRAALGRDLGAEGYPLDRLSRFVPERFPDLPLIDVAPALREGSQNYRLEDTHLSDLGNLRAGRLVGEALAQILPPAGFPTAESLRSSHPARSE